MATPFAFTESAPTISTTEISFITGNSTLTAQTDDATVTCFLDLSTMTAADQFAIRVYESVNGGAQKVVSLEYPTGVQSELFPIGPYALGNGWNITAQKITGTDRAIGCSIRRDVGDRNALTIGAAALTATAIAADAITAAKIADGAIDAATFAASAITATSIATGAITAAKFAAGAIDAAATSADFLTELVAAVLAGVVDGAKTVKGVLSRVDAFTSGKASGLLGTVAAFYGDDGTTKRIEATQDVTLGTRVAASTKTGD